MDIDKILSADYLDILFDGRNKEYGAYALRKTYNERLSKALLTTTIILLLLIACYLFASSFSTLPLPKELINNIELVAVKPDEVKPSITVPPTSRQEPVKIKTIINPIPVIVRDDVTEEMRPPDVDALESAAIGPIKQDGVADMGLEGPPANDEKRGIVSPPKKEPVDNDGVFRKVEIESAYPGGDGAWMRYLNKTFRYPEEAQEINIQGTVIVQFIVDTAGNVSNVEAIDGPVNGGLREEAIRVIKKSGKWEPAIQNGRKVKSYKKQPITFKLEAG